MRGCGAAGSDGSWADGERGECGAGGQRVRLQVSSARSDISPEILLHFFPACKFIATNALPTPP